MSLASRLACLAGTLLTAAVSILLTIVWFEGVPILRDIPLVGRIARGEIARRLETALSAYVLRSEKAALEARLRETERQRDGAAVALEELRRRRQADAEQDAADEARREREILDHEQALAAAGRSCRLDQRDLDFLLRQ